MNDTTLQQARPEAEGSLEFELRLERVMAAVDLHHLHLQDYLFRLTRHWQDAENLTQELWRYVLLNFPLEKIGALPLLRRKAYQLFVDHYRKLKRRPEHLTDTLPEVPATGGQEMSYSPEAEAALQRRFWDEYPGLELTGPQREVLWLHARHGHTYQEIAARTGVPVSTVGDWIALGRMRLTDSLNREP